MRKTKPENHILECVLEANADIIVTVINTF